MCYHNFPICRYHDENKRTEYYDSVPENEKNELEEMEISKE